MSDTSVIVPCPCPGTAHPEGDVVLLKDEPDVPMFVAFNITFESVAVDALSVNEWNADMQAAIAGVYLRHGIRSWTFTDDQEDTIPLSPANVARLLPWTKGGKAVVDACDELYGKALLAPFVEAATAARTRTKTARRRTRESSPPSPTATSTSRTPRSGSRLRVVSKPSSPDASDGKPSEVRAS